MKFWFMKAVTLLTLMPALMSPVVASTRHTSAGGTPPFVAGLAPYQRPKGAPVIRAFAPGADWRARSLTGVSEPVPASLVFLVHQGAWYTPFTRPGIPGYYDLRQWHQGEMGNPANPAHTLKR